MFIPDPGSWILIFLPILDPGSRIPDPKTSTKERGEEKKLLSYLFCSHKFHKIENYFIFEMLKKKIWPGFKRVIELFTKNLSVSSKKYGFGIRDPQHWDNVPRRMGFAGKSDQIRLVFGSSVIKSAECCQE
jgi:hypothetical protein